MRISAYLDRSVGRRGAAPPLFRRQIPGFLAFFASLLAGASLAFFTANSPLTGEPWDWRYAGVLLTALALLAATALGSRLSSIPRLIMLLSAMSLPALVILGANVQYTVNDRPVAAGTELHDALELHEQAERALEELLSQRYLLELPRSQARGVPETYREASELSRTISAAWNPASPSNASLPGIGFVPVLEAINNAADIQSDALSLYIQNAESPQPEIQATAQALSAESLRLLSEVIPGLLEDARLSSIALLAR